MILSPHHMWRLAQAEDDKADDKDIEELQNLHGKHRLDPTVSIKIPKYWVPTILAGMKKMVEEYPNMRFGSIIELQGQLKIYTIPSNYSTEVLKLEIYNAVDELIMDTIEEYAGKGNKPWFLT